jgi:hypothetical protein
MPQPLNLEGGGSGTILVRRMTRTLLHAYPSGAVLKVEQVLRVPGKRSHPSVEVRVPGKRSHPSVEVRALEVGHGLKTLLPYGALLILNQEKGDRQCYSSYEAVLTQGGESDVHHQLNVGVELTADDGP